MSEIVSLEREREAAIGRVVTTLRDGGVVVVPTDTVYGIAADAFNREATAAIFGIKRRPRSLPLPVLVPRPRSAWALAGSVPPGAAELVAAFWPGALTLVLPEVEGIEWDLGDAPGTVAVRMPAHEDLLEILTRAGPLAATSANLSGEQTPATLEQIAEKLGAGVALYVDGGPARADRGSTIVDLTADPPSLVREGPISAADVERALGRELRGA